MLRKLLFLIVVVILIGILLVYLDVINLRRTAGGGYEIETRDVQVERQTTNVQVPVVRTETRQIETPSVGLEAAENQATTNAQ